MRPLGKELIDRLGIDFQTDVPSALHALGVPPPCRGYRAPLDDPRFSSADPPACARARPHALVYARVVSACRARHPGPGHCLRLSAVLDSPQASRCGEGSRPSSTDCSAQPRCRSPQRRVGPYQSAAIKRPHTVYRLRPMLRITGSASPSEQLCIPAGDELARLRDEFGHRHCLLIPGFFDRALADEIAQRVASSDFYRREHPGIGARRAWR